MRHISNCRSDSRKVFSILKWILLGFKNFELIENKRVKAIILEHTSFWLIMVKLEICNYSCFLRAKDGILENFVLFLMSQIDIDWEMIIRTEISWKILDLSRLLELVLKSLANVYIHSINHDCKIIISLVVLKKSRWNVCNHSI